jgi:hypothetical protein
MYRRRVAFSGGYPFEEHGGPVQDYGPGLCPVTERAQMTVVMNDFIRPPATTADMADVVRAFEKVYENKDELRASL